MQRISSRNTFFLKRIAPIIAFVGLLLFLALPFIGGRPPLAWAFVSAGILAFVGVVGWFILKKMIFNLADEVFDDGDTLLVRNQGREERIQLSEIAAVRCNKFFPPDKVTLILKESGGFGKEIAFLQPAFVPLVNAPVIQSLINRIEAKRAG